MDDSEMIMEEELTFWGKHSFLLLIGISITIALVLVVISMELYASSGAAQLDLSRPGYSAVTSQAVTTDRDFENYPSVGQLNTASISEFKMLYDKQATKAKAVDAFSGDPLDPVVLEISAVESL
jgi:uncharacterized protein YpmS